MTAAAARSEPILTAKGIVNRFGKQTVHDGIDLEVKRGEILGIAGGSGSGKSVLMRTLTGLRRPDRGKVVIEDRPVESIHDGEKASLIGVLFQQGALFSSLSAGSRQRTAFGSKRPLSGLCSMMQPRSASSERKTSSMIRSSN